jgi:hypothetical protein
VRIPYDEDIFIGIDKNYKTLKKTLAMIKDIHADKMEELNRKDDEVN